MHIKKRVKKHKHFFRVTELNPFTQVCTDPTCNRKEIYEYGKKNKG